MKSRQTKPAANGKLVMGAALAVLLLLPAARAAEKAADPPSAGSAADEPMAEKFSLAKAAESLDRTSLIWTRQHKCGCCHVNYPFLMTRGALKDVPSPALAEVRKFFEDRVARWDADAKDAQPKLIEVVATAAALAVNDAQTTGRLHPLTRKALDLMWAAQRKDGAWDWKKCNWPPFESDDYYGAVLAAVGTGFAPDDYARSDAAKDGLAKLRAYLKATPPPNLHHTAWLLWASAKLDGLMTPDERQTAVHQLLAAQRTDGGWSLGSLGNGWVNHKGDKLDPDAPSDGYGTGLVLHALRQAGVAASHEAVQRGKNWLRTHQRASGRWFTASPNGLKAYSVAEAGNAFAVLALSAGE